MKPGESDLPLNESLSFNSIDICLNITAALSRNVVVVSELLLLLCIGIIVYTKLSQNKSNKPHKPYIKTLQRVNWLGFNFSIVDGFITLIKMRKDGIKMLEDLSLNHGSVFVLPFATMNVIAVSDCDILQKILNSPKIQHANKPQSLKFIFPDFLKNGLLLAESELWFPHRKAASKAFSYSSFPTYLNYIDKEARQLSATAITITSETCDGTVRNSGIKKLIDHHAMKIITHIIMGKESYSVTDKEISDFHESCRRGKEIVTDRLLSPELTPEILWCLHPKKRKLDQLIKEGTIFSNKITNRYRANTTKTQTKESSKINSEITVQYSDLESLPESPCQQPFECLAEKMIKAGLTNDEISDEVGTFLNVGHETVIISLEVLLFHLAKNIQHQENCRLEVDEMFSSKKGPSERLLNMEDPPKLKYLERCVLESLRLTPTIPVYFRQLDAPIEIKDGCSFDAGDTIMLMPWIVHRNPEYYPNPNTFDPSRFLGENVKSRHSHSFIPFSMGMRNCIGWKVAILEVKVIMANILRNFYITPGDDWTDEKLFFDVTLKTEGRFNVNLKRRK